MSFQFVENSKIDGAARKLIRSHVMIGKNAGKTRSRPARKVAGRSPLPNESFVVEGQVVNWRNRHESNEGGESVVTSIPRTVGDSFSTFTFPCEVQPYMKQIISQFMSFGSQAVYPAALCLPSEALKIGWLEFLMSDEAFFHSVLAMSEVSLDVRLGRQETSPRALHHLSNTYRCISQNLQKDGEPSDSTIASVMSMAIHEDLRGHPARSKVHLDALQRMVELRGGLAEFKANCLLSQKICRADIQYVLWGGSSPRFNRDHFPSEIIQSILDVSVSQMELSRIADDAHIYGSELRDVLMDFMGVCRLLNDNRTGFKLPPFAFQDILLSVSYRLLHRYPLAVAGPEDLNESACHLGLLALVTTLLFQYGRAWKLHYDLLADKLRKTIEGRSSNGVMEETTFLWLLFIGGISVFEGTDRAWLHPHIKNCLFEIKIDTWLSARERIRKLPWIDIVHDKSGQELWQAVIWG